MASTHNSLQRFKADDWVAFRFGNRTLVAQVAEARGALGRNGRQLYRVRVRQESGDPDSFEMPEDELQPATPPDKQEIINYLKSTGLVAMLRANLGGGADQPKAWLTYAPRGSLTHTFEPGRGLMGGSLIPFFALYGDKVFIAKKSEVIGFLRTFGLEPTEAEDIVAAVGTAP